MGNERGIVHGVKKVEKDGSINNIFGEDIHVKDVDDGENHAWEEQSIPDSLFNSP